MPFPNELICGWTLLYLFSSIIDIVFVFFLNVVFHVLQVHVC